MINSYQRPNTMRRTIKFTISMPAAEFRDIESLRRKTGRTRSQFIRDVVSVWKHSPARILSVKEDKAEYEAAPAPEIVAMTDPAERRRRAIAAAGRFRSGSADLSSNHDRYLEEAFDEDLPREKKG